VIRLDNERETTHYIRVRLPFDIVAAKEAAIFYRTVRDATNLSFAVEKYLNEYYDLLNYSGWTAVDYERELLSRIDKEWNKIYQKQCEQCTSN
jgi:hypothetical protein